MQDLRAIVSHSGLTHIIVDGLLHFAVDDADIKAELRINSDRNEDDDEDEDEMEEAVDCPPCASCTSSSTAARIRLLRALHDQLELSCYSHAPTLAEVLALTVELEASVSHTGLVKMS